MPAVHVNGTQLYYEVRGHGPSLLLIAGGGLDGGTFGAFANVLAGRFRVVTYDRRGLSRSPGPQGWSSTSIEEQAGDAAGLLQAVGLAPAAVIANSLGALIALELMLRHPDLVRSATLLDTGPVDTAVADRRERMPMPEDVRTALASGGEEARRAAFESLLRFLGIWDLLDGETQERTLCNSDVFFSYETPLLSAYRPDEKLMSASRVPVQVAAGERTAPVMREMAEWLADRLQVKLLPIPGGHLGFLEDPAEVAAAIMPFLEGAEDTEV